ncbi:MAG: PEP-CTERM sorting domain-containing protein [Opitutae bacterium]|nr:PEP-CTERM sorting domain-containing protein [Opitutae bacterium]
MGGAAQIDANGYVTPMGVSAVPEPSTYAAIFGAMALGAVAVIRQRRRAVAVLN